MKKIILYAIIPAASLFITSCGNGTTETVKADSSITSASVARAPLPETINTDTTTAAPVADTTESLKKTDTAKHKTPPQKITKNKKISKAKKQPNKNNKKK
jgi:hypothetical protein